MKDKLDYFLFGYFAAAGATLFIGIVALVAHGLQVLLP